VSPEGQLSQLDKLKNIASSIGEKGATVFDKGRAALEEGNIFSKDFLTAAVPGQAAAAGDLAYMTAQKALDEYDQQQAALGAMGVANTEARKAAIRKAMGLSGYTTDEIESTILKFNFANGGRVGYQMGGGTKPPSMPMNPDMLAMAIFGKSYDQLTYTQKSAIDDMLATKKAEGGRIGYEGGGPISLGMELYLMAKKTFEEQGYNSKEAHEKALEVSGIKSVVKEYGPGVKKAEGGIMDLGGNEMDLRAKGGFVPIGKKERADDVPARLSKNEFVFTAKAVRNAGNGDIREGARKMYNLMNKLEARK
jgi:hypothetical protein